MNEKKANTSTNVLWREKGVFLSYLLVILFTRQQLDGRIRFPVSWIATLPDVMFMPTESFHVLCHDCLSFFFLHTICPSVISTQPAAPLGYYIFQKVPRP